MKTKGRLLGIPLATVMVVMVKEEVSKVLTTVLTTPLMMPAAVVGIALAQLSLPFHCAEIKHKLSF